MQCPSFSLRQPNQVNIPALASYDTLQPRDDDTESADSIGFLIPNGIASKVIGYDGAGLQQIYEACGRKVDAKPEGDPFQGDALAAGWTRVSLSGDVHQICTAFAMAASMAYSEAAECTAHVRIPANWAGRVIGKGGENLKKARTLHNVTIAVERQPVAHAMTGAAERLLEMQGATSQLSSALAILLESQLRQGGCAGAAAIAGTVGYNNGLPVAGMLKTASLPSSTPSAPSQVLAEPPPTDPEDCTVFVAVPENLAGVILGKGGGTIKELGTRANCKMRMTSRAEGAERRVVMSGGMDQVIVAQELVRTALQEGYAANGQQEPLQYVATMLIRIEACDAVVGENGCGITALQVATGAHAVITEGGDTAWPCLLEGSAEQVYRAMRDIHATAKQVPIDPSVKAKHPSSGVKRAADSLSNQPYAQLSSEAKRRRIDDHLGASNLEDNADAETRLLIPEQTAGLVIGKQGVNLKAVRETYNVRLDMLPPDRAPQWPGDRLVILRGTSASRIAATAAVLQFTQKTVVEQVSAKLLVPTVKLANVIGEGSSNLRYFHEYYGVAASVNSEEIAGECAILVYGQAEKVIETAKQLISLQDGEQAHPAVCQHTAHANPGLAPVYSQSPVAFVQMHQYLYGAQSSPGRLVQPALRAAPLVTLPQVGYQYGVAPSHLPTVSGLY